MPATNRFRRRVVIRDTELVAAETDVAPVEIGSHLAGIDTALEIRAAKEERLTVRFASGGDRVKRQRSVGLIRPVGLSDGRSAKAKAYPEEQDRAGGVP